MCEIWGAVGDFTGLLSSDTWPTHAFNSLNTVHSIYMLTFGAFLSLTGAYVEPCRMPFPFFFFSFMSCLCSQIVTACACLMCTYLCMLYVLTVGCPFVPPKSVQMSFYTGPRLLFFYQTSRHSVSGLVHSYVQFT